MTHHPLHLTCEDAWLAVIGLPEQSSDLLTCVPAVGDKLNTPKHDRGEADHEASTTKVRCVHRNRLTLGCFLKRHLSSWLIEYIDDLTRNHVRDAKVRFTDLFDIFFCIFLLAICLSEQRCLIPYFHTAFQPSAEETPIFFDGLPYTTGGPKLGLGRE